MEAKNATAASWSNGEDNVATHFERLTRPGRSNTAPDTSATRRSVTPTNWEGRGGWFVGGSCDGAEVTSPEAVALESAVEPRRCDAVATRAAGRTAEGSEARRRTDEEAALREGGCALRRAVATAARGCGANGKVRSEARRMFVFPRSQGRSCHSAGFQCGFGVWEQCSLSSADRR